MKITTILPASRMKYLERVLDSLDAQTHKFDKLIVIYEGNDYDAAFNYLVDRKPDYELSIARSNNDRVSATISDRRRNISNIHNQFKDMITDEDWIFSIEDDGILPPESIARLLAIAKANPDAGMITGVELGRWGVPYVGAWRVDNVYDPKTATSLESRVKDPIVEEIDACGLYCALIRPDMYKNHTFFCENGLGPDVNLGLFLRQQGLRNFIDWSLPLTHLGNHGGFEVEIPATDNARVVTLTSIGDNRWHHSY